MDIALPRSFLNAFKGHESLFLARQMCQQFTTMSSISSRRYLNSTSLHHRRRKPPSTVDSGCLAFPRRTFISSEPSCADGDSLTTQDPASVTGSTALSRLSRTIARNSGPAASRSTLSGIGSSIEASNNHTEPTAPTNYISNEHHLYVYAHKHNTHITLTEPQHEDPNKPGRRRQKVLLTLSTGNLGFRKSARGSYDAAYQLGAYVMSRIQTDGLLARIHRLELVLRGFGQGREALTKILLGMEGANLRERVIRVVDASRVKMGGQRAPKPRRLG